MKIAHCVQLAAGLALLSLLPSLQAAGSATWNPNATSGVWYSSTNWIPGTIPNTIADTATFGASSITTITEAPGGFTTNLNAFVFNPGASAYTISFSSFLPYAMIGTGVSNNSGILQAFSIPASTEFRDENETNNTVALINGATAGTLTQWTIRGSSFGAYRPASLVLDDSATASSATIIVAPGGLHRDEEDGDGYGGELVFQGSSTADHSTITLTGGVAGAYYGAPPEVDFVENSTAGNAVITATGGTVGLGFGGLIYFSDNATAADCVIVNQAGAVQLARNGQTFFGGNSSAGNATISALGGPGDGGRILFFESSTGGTARCLLRGDGRLDISLHLDPGVTIGSLEGQGYVSLGAHNLAIGSNNLVTSFRGIIDDGPPHQRLGGSLTKIGTGSLTLTGPSTYIGGTTVSAGKLVIDNQAGSGTGKGPVVVAEGTLAGSGIIGGPVIIATSGSQFATLEPGPRDRGPGTLTTLGRLTVNDKGVYVCTFNASGGAITSDQVIANSVILNQGAAFLFNGFAHGKVTLGTVITVIDNTAATPIMGEFAGVPEGAILVNGGGHFKVSYQGGDGNDLTLTAVP